MRKFIIVVVVIVGLVIIVNYTKNTIAKSLLTTVTRNMLGLKANIKTVNVGVFKTSIDIEGVKIYNPSGYPDKLMAEIPKLYLNLKLRPLLEGKIYLDELKLNLKELIVLKNKKGELNLSSLKPAKKRKKTQVAENKKGKFHIDVLHLKIGKIVYKDYSQGKPPKIEQYNLNIDEEYKNINDPKKVIRLVLTKAVINTAITELTDLDIKGLKASLSGSAGQTSKFINEQSKKVLKSGKGLSKNTQKEIEKATKTIKDILPLDK